MDESVDSSWNFSSRILFEWKTNQQRSFQIVESKKKQKKTSKQTNNKKNTQTKENTQKQN